MRYSVKNYLDEGKKFIKGSPSIEDMVDSYEHLTSSERLGMIGAFKKHKMSFDREDRKIFQLNIPKINKSVWVGPEYAVKEQTLDGDIPLYSINKDDQTVKVVSTHRNSKEETTTEVPFKIVNKGRKAIITFIQNDDDKLNPSHFLRQDSKSSNLHEHITKKEVPPIKSVDEFEAREIYEKILLLIKDNSAWKGVSSSTSTWWLKKMEAFKKAASPKNTKY